MAEHEQRSESLVQTLAATRDSSTSLVRETEPGALQLQQKRGRIASLEALQQAAMEDGSQGVGEWLAAQQMADKARLLEQMQVDDGWQLAVETVLGDYLQAVCVDDIGVLGSYLDSLQQGQLLLVELQRARPGACLPRRTGAQWRPRQSAVGGRARSR